MPKEYTESVHNFITVDDGTKISVNKWKRKGLLAKKPTYLICICHGMAEHSQRYSDFANFLLQNDAIVYAHDHRGHGKTAETADNLGFLAEKDGFNRVVLDLRAVIKQARDENPGLKAILLGHSFGSFISQSYIQQFGDEIDACILSGSAGPNPILTIPGEIIAKCIKSIQGMHHPSKFLDNMSFGTYLNKIDKPCANFAWLSRDTAQVKKYEDDPLCGFLCTVGFFADLTHGLNSIHKKENMRRVRKNLPIYIFAGTGDPVGAYTKSLKKLAELYRKLEITIVDEKYYINGRHEMLNEINREEVYTDIVEWIKEKV